MSPLAPYGLLGADASIAMPLVDDKVARAALAISPASKRGGKLYDAAFERINPQLIMAGNEQARGRFPFGTNSAT